MILIIDIYDIDLLVFIADASLILRHALIEPSWPADSQNDKKFT